LFSTAIITTQSQEGQNEEKKRDREREKKRRERKKENTEAALSSIRDHFLLTY